MADVLYPKPSIFNSGWRAIPIDNWLGKNKTMTSFIHRTVGEAPNKVRGGGGPVAIWAMPKCRAQHLNRGFPISKNIYKTFYKRISLSAMYIEEKNSRQNFC